MAYRCNSDRHEWESGEDAKRCCGNHVFVMVPAPLLLLESYHTCYGAAYQAALDKEYQDTSRRENELLWSRVLIPQGEGDRIRFYRRIMSIRMLALVDGMSESDIM